ncbi:hypothetical protein B0H21DRAFT_820990 [Amylocystis lapponica]|nr:hypothetical protein B0H21DRAFT_820990 [Amylocystis lapponica]
MDASSSPTPSPPRPPSKRPKFRPHTTPGTARTRTAPSPERAVRSGFMTFDLPPRSSTIRIPTPFASSASAPLHFVLAGTSVRSICIISYLLSTFWEGRDGTIARALALPEMDAFVIASPCPVEEPEVPTTFDSGSGGGNQNCTIA